MTVTPSLPGRPAALTGDEGRLGLRRSLLTEALGKSSTLGGLRGRRKRRSAPLRSLESEPLLTSQVELLRALLTAEQAVLGLEHPLLLALGSRAFHLLRLQLLNALLQAIDAGLALRRLARQHLALSLLDVLRALLDALLALKKAALRLQQPLLLVLRPCAFRLLRLQLLHALLQAVDAVLAFRGLARKHLAWRSRSPAHGRGCTWARRGCDMRCRPRRHGRTLRRCRRPMEFAPWRRHLGGGSRGAEMWGLTRRR
ncbi:hypothetical protein [Bradyrhizobium tunisiense]|uniref:hypothetical protein n=1 Tax=Bradyrhizobium tunisiense TaxID=3278709 RepID=UPI002013531F|nr:hypothetical protein [Bradyrhizobium diazoefficiens]